MSKPKYHLMIFIVSMALMFIDRDGWAEIDIVNCSSDITCSVKTYRAESPILMVGHSIAASSAAPIPPENIVAIIYDGISASVVCNNMWQNLSSSSGKLDLQNTVRCRISGDRQTIEMDLGIYNQATHDTPYATAPSESGYAELADTSEGAPYCQNETFTASATACKWQTYDGSQWLVYAKTTVENLSIGLAVPSEAELSSFPEYFCARNVDGNGVIDSGEFGECVNTPQGRLCSVDRVQCEPTYASPECTGEGVFNPVIDKCEYPVECPGGAYSPHLQKCVTGLIQECEGRECEPGCPAGYSESDGLCVQVPCEALAGEYVFFPTEDLCVSEPICPSGVYDPTTNQCYEGHTDCPYGDEYACMEYQSERWCSPTVCLDDGALETGEQSGEEEGDNDIYDNGPVDPVTGECLGQLYIFNGKDRRCRSDGVTIAFDDCCKDKDYLFGLVQCSSEELELAGLKQEGLCHYVGRYCSKKVFFGGCLEHKKTYCCYNSKLGRIIQEQGRFQLSTFSGWGSDKQPDCRGLTPEEFQMLDFSKIDLSEYYGDIEVSTEEEIRNKIENGIIDNFGGSTPGGAWQ